MVDILVSVISLLPVVTVFIGVIKFINRVLNRNELEKYITMYDKITWENNAEILLACLFMVLGVNIPVLVFDISVPAKLAEVIFICSSMLLLITVILIGLIGLPFEKFKFINQNKIIHDIIPKIPFTLLLTLILANVSYSILHLPEKVTSNFLVGYITVIYIIYTALIFVSLNTLNFIAKPSISAIKVEAIPDALIENVLTKLCFIYALDNERHVMSHVPVKKDELVLPAYIYYPKENRLIKYYRERMLVRK
ncbi:Uncharacterised protein [Chlamydia abortus]|nr:Uncharacterised protein [Chlamydia abortus]